jgi:hypothetical protein
MLPETLLNALALANQVLTAAIAILGSSLLLYSFTYHLGQRVARAFSTLLACVVVVYLCDAILALVEARPMAEWWLRAQWIGIAFMPAAYLHLSDALLATTGVEQRWGRRGVRLAYLVGLAVVVLALASDWLVSDGVTAPPNIPHLRAGPLFWMFALYFGLTVGGGIYNVVRTWRRRLTPTARYRLRYLLFSFLAPAAGAFPYMVIASAINTQAGPGLRALFYVLLFIGNSAVAVMLTVMAYGIAYFGVLTPDRVVRARMVKFLVRGALVSTVTLLAIVVVRRAGPLLGIPAADAVIVVAVGVNLLLQWVIASTKRTLERGLYLNERDEIRRIQQLQDRLLTSRDLHQFLESVLAAACDRLRAPSGFIVATTEERPRVEMIVGTLALEPEHLETEDWGALVPAEAAAIGAIGANGADGADGAEEPRPHHFLWNGYVIVPLHNRAGDVVLGILGAAVPPGGAGPAELALLDTFARQAASAIEDRLLQEEVFAALEGLMPAMEAIQQRRGAARYGGAEALTAAVLPGVPTDPELAQWVRDALSHYWGGPKLTDSPLLQLQVVQRALAEHDGNPARALRAVLLEAIERLKPEGERRMTTGEWILYNILELKFVQGRRVRDVAMQLAMSESDLYRKQRVAVEEVARVIATMERAALEQG